MLCQYLRYKKREKQRCFCCWRQLESDPFWIIKYFDLFAKIKDMMKKLSRSWSYTLGCLRFISIDAIFPYTVKAAVEALFISLFKDMMSLRWLIPWIKQSDKGFHRKKMRWEEQTFTYRNPDHLVKPKDNGQIQLY